MSLIKCVARNSSMSKDVKFCPECGTENTAGAEKCQNVSSLGNEAQAIINAVNANIDLKCNDLKKDITFLGKDVDPKTEQDAITEDPKGHLH